MRQDFGTLKVWNQNFTHGMGNKKNRLSDNYLTCTRYICIDIVILDPRWASLDRIRGAGPKNIQGH